MAGAVVGSLYSDVQFHNLPACNFMLGLVLGLTTSLAELRVFGGEREVFWREASPGSGMNLSAFAYFAAKSCVELVRIAILVGAVLITFYPLAKPQMGFVEMFDLCYVGALMATGVPILFSTSMDPKSSQLATVIFILVMNMMSGNQVRSAKNDSATAARQQRDSSDLHALPLLVHTCARPFAHTRLWRTASTVGD